MAYRDAGYARISKDDLRLGKGVARQQADIERVSAESGGELVAMLTDNHVSASRYSTKKRPGYEQLLAMATAGQIDRIIVYRLDRLLRIPKELEKLIELCEQRRLLVVNLNGSMDLRTAEGRKHARGRVADAAFESDLISERTRDAFDQLAAEGRPHSGIGGARAFGYEDDGLTIRESEAELIRTAAQDVLVAGTPINEIARRWNRAGFRTARHDTLWTNRTVRTVLTGPRIAGIRIHRRGQEDEKRYPATWPAIIDEATHTALIRKLVAQSARRPGRRTEYTGLFVARVGDEVHPMRRDRNRSTPVYRTYPRFPGDRPPRMQVGPATDLEALVREALFVYAESGDLAAKIAQRRAESERPVVESVADVKRLLEQLAEDEADGLVTRGEWLVKRKRLLPRLAAAQKAEAASSAVSVLDGVSLDLRARWPDYDVDRRASILREVFDRIEITPAMRMGPGFDESRVHPVWR